MTQTAFEERVLTKLLPEFCDDKTRGWGSEGFRNGCSKISEADAVNFIRGMDAGLLEHVGRGQYLAPMSRAKLQFFWEGEKAISPRPVSLWIEPIIVVACLSRLHLDFGWPKELLGAESVDWAFDVVAHLSKEHDGEYIACEVKKSHTELHRLVEFMKLYGAHPSLGLPISDGQHKGPRKNAYNKVVALRKRAAPIFCAVGPNDETLVFQLSYGQDGSVMMEDAPLEMLAFPGSANF